MAFGRLQPGIDRPGKRIRLFLHAESLADGVYLVEDALMIEAFPHFDIGNAGPLQHIDRFPGAATLKCQNPARIDGEHAFRRKLAHVADIGQLERFLRIDAGRIAGDQPFLLAERENDLGKRAADRGNLRAIRESARVVRGAGANRRREHERGCDSGGSCQLR